MDIYRRYCFEPELLQCEEAEVSADHHIFPPGSAVQDQGVDTAEALERLLELFLRVVRPNARIVLRLLERRDIDVFDLQFFLLGGLFRRFHDVTMNGLRFLMTGIGMEGDTKSPS